MHSLSLSETSNQSHRFTLSGSLQVDCNAASHSEMDKLYQNETCPFWNIFANV